jgi:hypothetical protein
LDAEEMATSHGMDVHGYLYPGHGIFPVLWSVLQMFQNTTITQWSPLTLQGAGLFHIAMGAVLGIAAFGRTQEKLAGAAVNPTAPGTPLPTPAPSMSFSSAPAGTKIEPSFAPAPAAAVTTGFGGKKAPPEPDYPEL